MKTLSERREMMKQVFAFLTMAGLLLLTSANPQAAGKEDLLVLGATSGGAAHIISCGLAELINKGNYSVRTSCQETFGSVDNVRKIAGRQNVVGLVADLTYWLALEGKKPFKKPYTTLRATGLNSVATYAFISIDPKIKTKEDLVGKKIAVGKAASAISNLSEFLLGNIWGIWDKVDRQYLGWGAGRPALKDGLVDAMLVIIGVSADDRGKPKWTAHPSFSEIIALKDVTFIGPTREEVQAAGTKYGYPVSQFQIPDGTFGSRQKGSFGAVSVANAYFADATMPDEMSYEFMRAQYELHKEWASYHAQVKYFTPKTLGFAPVRSEADYHPGALKFLKEKNVPLYYGGNAPPFE
jgi:TRAP transporter TAXI family solute receptor